MASKSISITNEVYDLLKQFQLKGESFSQTILRLIKRQENIMKLAGSWKDIPESKEVIEIVEDVIDKARKEPNDQISMI